MTTNVRFFVDVRTCSCFCFCFFFFSHEDCDFYYVFIIINYARVLRMGLSSISVVPNGLFEFLDPRR